MLPHVAWATKQASVSLMHPSKTRYELASWPAKLPQGDPGENARSWEALGEALDNSMDRGAWWITVHGATKNLG